jgi:peptidyl-prolyl cis-trans isomerase D
MTMLDRMRRHQYWLKWCLFVVVIAFVLVYVPQFLSPGGMSGAAPSDAVATVAGRKITAMEFQRAYAGQLEQIRANAGGNVSEDMIRQLQIGPRVLQQMVTREAILAEGERLGLTVSDGELRERLMRFPAFQENGQFIGTERYRQLLDSGRPPVRPAEFEASLRKQILAQKLETALTGWVRVSDAEIDEEYLRRNEKVQLEVAVFNGTQFEAGIVPTDADLAAEFQAHPDTYRTAEKRRVSYLVIDATTLRDSTVVTAQEIEARYNQNRAQYSTPEQIRASHILLKTEGKDKAAVRKAAEGVLAKVKAGGDFAALAKQFSEDTESAAKGGDLDYFGRGAMVAEFDQAAWNLKPGEITPDLVESQFGFHIIKLVDHRAPETRTLDQVRVQLEEQIKREKAEAEASRVAAEIAKEIKAPADLDRVAAARKLTVGDSGLFSREEPIAGLGFAPTVAAEAFRLEKDKVSGMIATGQGFAFVALKEIAPSAMPQLADVKDKVRLRVVQIKAVARAADKAKEMAAGAKANFASAAKAAGVAVKTTEMIARGASLPEVGVSEAVDSVAFKLAKGDTAGPIEVGSSVVVIRVKDRQDIDPAARDAAREGLRGELGQQRRGTFFSAYMARVMEDLQKNNRITYNEDVLTKVVGK